MIVDLILDRKDGVPYNAKKFYNYCREETSIFKYYIGEKITLAMDYGTNEDVQEALCAYILDQNYSPDICDYIRSVNWLREEKLNPMCYRCKTRDRKMCRGTAEMVWTGCAMKEN